MNIIKSTYLHFCYFQLHKLENIAFFAIYANLGTVSGPDAKSILESCLSRFHLKKRVWDFGNMLSFKSYSINPSAMSVFFTTRFIKKP